MHAPLGGYVCDSFEALNYAPPVLVGMVKGEALVVARHSLFEMALHVCQTP
jgi:hypothetical protein